jgi:hypothetical protein
LVKNNFFLKFFRSAFLISVTVFVTQHGFSQTEFIENKGQWDSRVKFMTQAGNGAFFLQKNGFTILQHNQLDMERMIHKTHNRITPASALQYQLRSHAYAVEFT